jgi:hypothetical protein
MDSKVNIKVGEILYNPHSNLFSMYIEKMNGACRMVSLLDKQDENSLNLEINHEYTISKYLFDDLLTLSEIKIPKNIYLSNHADKGIYLGFNKNTNNAYLIAISCPGSPHQLNYTVNLFDRYILHISSRNLISDYYQIAPKKFKYKIK